MYILFYSQNHCCGAKDPNDWNLNVYFNCSDSNLSRERCGVPFSCCISDPAVGSPLLHSSPPQKKNFLFIIKNTVEKNPLCFQVEGQAC